MQIRRDFIEANYDFLFFFLFIVLHSCLYVFARPVVNRRFNQRRPAYVYDMHDDPNRTGSAAASTLQGLLAKRYFDVCAVFFFPFYWIIVNSDTFLCLELCHEYAVEWDSEIEEFLPAVTEDNLEVLQRAGETGEQSPTPHDALAENQIGTFGFNYYRCL